MTDGSAPSGTLFFVHGANETSDGLARNVDRITTQVRARGWDVKVVAPEWRRRSGLRLGAWQQALYRRGRPSAVSLPSVRAGLGTQAVMKLVTSHFEHRREALINVIGPQMLADVIGYHQHRATIHAILREELERTAATSRGPVLPVALSLGGIALVDLLGDWPDAPVEACVTVGSQAPLMYAFDALPSMPYSETDPPHLSVGWLNVYDSRDFLSFLAEPLFRRSDGLASVIDRRVQSGRDFPKSHSAYWEQPGTWESIAFAFSWRRTPPITVKEAREAGFEARKRPAPRG